jgi:hypothetical protein
MALAAYFSTPMMLSIAAELSDAAFFAFAIDFLH